MINAAKINTCDTRYCTCNNTAVDWARPSAIVSSTTRSECWWVWVCRRKINVHKRMNDNLRDTRMCVVRVWLRTEHLIYRGLCFAAKKKTAHIKEMEFSSRKKLFFFLRKIWGLQVHLFRTFCRENKKEKPIDNRLRLQMNTRIHKRALNFPPSIVQAD